MEGNFLVSSLYLFSTLCRVPHGLRNKFDKVLALICKIEVLFKVKAFGWRCFLNKLLMKDLLLSRGNISTLSDCKCVFCGCTDESLIHSFLTCNVSYLIWREMTYWIGMVDYLVTCSKESFFSWIVF